MVSDVEAEVANSLKRANSVPSPASQGSTRTGDQILEGQPQPKPQTHRPAAQSSGSPSIGIWLFGVAAVIGVIWFAWFAAQSGNHKSSGPAYSPGSSSTSVAPAPARKPRTEQPQVPSRPTEDKPSVGRNNVLATAQIRYCLAEKIRLDAAKSVINNYVGSDVDLFNAHVNDYNSRCGEFRYRQNTLESARRDIEPYRSQLQAEGRSRFVSSPSAATRSKAPSQVRPTPDATVQAIQHRLNEFGYNAGSADGFFGSSTRSAILAFQNDTGLPSDGVASSALLARLNATTRRPIPSPDRESMRGANGGQTVISQPRVTYSNEASIDKDNYKKCIDGRYPSLCDHTLLTQSEAARVDAAERKANFGKCIDGRYPSLCDHTLLTQSEAARVDAAERKANFGKCIDGRYPSLCDHTLLTQSEAARVDAAERKANFDKCIDGRYPSLCDHTLLTQSEAARVDAAERKANFDKCIDGRYPSLCDHAMLTSQEAVLVRDAERRAGRGY
nr:peptidoglycan-binding protein [Pseudomonas insulae]